MLFAFVTLVPEHRIVVKDGFLAQKMAEGIAGKEPMHLFKGSIKEEILRLPGTKRRKKVNRVSISPDLLTPKKLATGEKQYPEVTSLAIVPAFLFALFPSPVGAGLLIISILIGLVLWATRLFSMHESLTLFLLVSFNPLILFYTDHCGSLDSYAFIAVALYLLCYFTIAEKPRLTVERKDIFTSFALGISLIFASLGNPFTIALPFLFLLIHIALNKLSPYRLMHHLSAFMALAFLFGFYAYWAQKFDTSIWEIISHHPILNGENLVTPYIRGSRLLGVSESAHISPFLAFYIVVRTLVLAFPVFLIFVPAYLSSNNIDSESTPFYLELVSSILVFIILTLLFSPLDMSHYMLAGRSLLPIAFLGALLSASWLQRRMITERIVFLIIVTAIGLAGFAFFMARLRLDPFQLNILSALDKNFNRVYLVFQLFD